MSLDPRSIVEVVVAVAATITALGVIARTRPVRWLFRTTVGEPVCAWFRREVGDIVDERLDRRPLTNGWGTQAVHEIAKAVDADVPAPKLPEDRE